MSADKCNCDFLPSGGMEWNPKCPLHGERGTHPLHRMVLRLAELARRGHYYCEDTWYSCPKHPEGCANDSAGTERDCGADKINAEVDAILALLSQNEKDKQQ